MPVRIWGKTDSGLVVVEAHPAGRGLELIGLPSRRTRTTRDRLWSALLNSELLSERAGACVTIHPQIRAGVAAELDLALALAVLAAPGTMPARQLRRTLAVGRVRLDGSLVPLSAPIEGVPGHIRGMIIPNGSDLVTHSEDGGIEPYLLHDLREASRYGPQETEGSSFSTDAKPRRSAKSIR